MFGHKKDFSYPVFHIQLVYFPMKFPIIVIILLKVDSSSLFKLKHGPMSLSIAESIVVQNSSIN